MVDKNLEKSFHLLYSTLQVLCGTKAHIVPCSAGTWQDNWKAWKFGQLLSWFKPTSSRDSFDFLTVNDSMKWHSNRDSGLVLE